MPPPPRKLAELEAYGVSRRATADVLRKLRTIQKDIRMLKARMDTAHKDSQQPALARKRR